MFWKLRNTQNSKYCIYTNGLCTNCMLILQYKRQQFRTPSTVQLSQPASINMKAKILIVALCAFQVRQQTALTDIT